MYSKLILPFCLVFPRRSPRLLFIWKCQDKMLLVVWEKKYWPVTCMQSGDNWIFTILYIFQVLTLILGIALLLISLVVVYFTNSSADVLFRNGNEQATWGVYERHGMGFLLSRICLLCVESELLLILCFGA